MASKEQIFNLALGAMLLSRQIVSADTDKSNEANVLRTHYQTALNSALQDMDLDGTSSDVQLALISLNPTTTWGYSYAYPANCAFLRRIKSAYVKDNRYTQIPKAVTIIAGVKVILTSQQDAVATIIPTDLPLSTLSDTAALAVAYRLAMLSAPLVTGKGSKTLIEQIQQRYLLAKAEAQEQDRNENFVYDPDEIASEWVAARTS